jgi:E3 ubiquitin-protein ligase EDD1
MLKILNPDYVSIIIIIVIFVFTAADPHSARRDFLSYCLSLMRAHNAEHLDSLPILDVSALKHIAYVFDALIYYMRSGTESPDADVLRDGLPMESWNDQVTKAFNFCIRCL